MKRTITIGQVRNREGFNFSIFFSCQRLTDLSRFRFIEEQAKDREEELVVSRGEEGLQVSAPTRRPYARGEA